jgi:putative transposase
MPRTNRLQPAGVVFHVLNRGNDRRELFSDAGDYEAFLKIMAEGLQHHRVALLAYCLMPNHWHLVLRPEADGDMGRFMQRLTVTHVRRWCEHRHAVGLGHLYQGTYKSFPVQDDAHFLAVCRYVERNPLRAGLVPAAKAHAWRYSSLWQRDATLPARALGVDWPPLTAWPVDVPRNWMQRVNQPENEAELEALRTCVRRGQPFGSAAWTVTTAASLGLTNTVRPRGRPRKGAGPR